MSYALAIDYGTSYTCAAINVDGRVDVLRFDGDPHLGDVAFDPVDAVAAVLREVPAAARRHENGRSPRAVRLTHPARWGRRRRSALVDAAAHHFAHSPRVSITPGDLIAVYDLGGGTFDTAVLRCTAPDVFELAGPPGGTAGDEDTAEIGGDIFDRRILEYCGREIADEDSEAWTSIRRPLVEARVRERFGRADTQDDPKSIVALGAAAMDLERRSDAPAGEPATPEPAPPERDTTDRVPPPRDAPDPVSPRPLDRARLIGVPAIAAFVALCSVAAAGLGPLQAVSILSQFSGSTSGSGLWVTALGGLVALAGAVALGHARPVEGDV